MLKDFIRKIKNKNIHIVGVTGAEGSSVLRLLSKHHITNITAHDFSTREAIEKSFRLWHKGITTEKRNKLFKTFLADLSETTFYSGKNYLKDVTSADIIFVPQSWRLYKEKNSSLWKAKKKNIPFYSLTRLYLDWVPARVVAVTGTVGKGSVANILFQLLKNAGKKAYFAGNETWMLQIADKLDAMSKKDILILEISHRQLQDGFSKAPKVVIFTNLFPNHLDEVTWEEYVRLKLSLVKLQKPTDVSIINFDLPKLRKVASGIKSKVVFYSEENKNMNIKNIQNFWEQILSIKSIHFSINILAATTAASMLGLSSKQIFQNLAAISSLPARLELLESISGVNYYDDIKSTTPWATLAGVKRLKPAVLICGGKTKGIDYSDFVSKIRKQVKYTIFLKSQLSESVRQHLPEESYQIVDSLHDALRVAYQKSRIGENVLISPAAGFFYSEFIKGKRSLRRLITSLPLKEKE